jgi:transposase
MNRRPWPVAILLAMAVAAVAGCGTEPRPDADQLAGELAEVRADRDHLAALVKRLAATSATLENYTINDRQGGLDTLRAVGEQVDNTRAALKTGKANAKHAASQLGSASNALTNALARHCAPADP